MPVIKLANKDIVFPKIRDNNEAHVNQFAVIRSAITQKNADHCHGAVRRTAPMFRVSEIHLEEACMVAEASLGRKMVSKNVVMLTVTGPKALPRRAPRPTTFLSQGRRPTALHSDDCTMYHVPWRAGGVERERAADIDARTRNRNGEWKAAGRLGMRMGKGGDGG
ncbi:hypothetical protein Zmor_024758 [Zophobas morio]|uniref:Uncharacterized protein n=1 Tax=Zophobas morio TaxID=2755281 RepID=A0AA38M8U8_9CUCU|nr:hypothetical protein Zmor_024758 [Zophobas morio]